MKSKENIYKITFIILILDQIIKIIINNNMNLYDKIKIIPNFFSIFYVKNTGAAFSILENSTIPLIIISVIFVIILDRYIKSEESFTKLQVTSLGLILGGVFGNLIDRIIHHAVIDYLSFKIINYEFPIFNLADICITLGIAILIFNIIFEHKLELKK
jgi:signal peptidase II